MSKRERMLTSAIAGSFVTLWLTYVLILPPFEGFDETAHYSYISLLADEWEIPDFRKTPLDATITRELAGLPRPYAGSPPFEENGGITYAEFFQPAHRPEAAAAAERLWSAPSESALYTPGEGLNWQGQHPPLFYALMTIPYRLGTDWAPGMRLLVMRLVCVLLVSCSLVFWYMTLCAAQEPATRRMLLGGGGAVLLLPSCSYDLARLGNDSLAVLLLSAVVYYCFRASQRGHMKDYFAVAVALGAGLLTKAFFVPVTFGVVCYFAGCLVHARSRSHVLGAAMMAVVPLLISGMWFAYYQARYGTPLGSQETYLFSLGRAAGEALSVVEFVRAVARSVAAFGATFLWCGSWSWVQRPHWQYVLMAPLMLLAAGTFLRSVLLKQRQACSETRALGWIAAAILGPILLAFGYHILLRVRYTGIGSGTGGYYLFFAWSLVGIGFAGIWSLGTGRWRRLVLTCAVTAAVLFEAGGLWFSAQVYAGFIEKVGTTKIGEGGMAFSLENLLELHQRLGYLGFPTLALACYAGSLGLRVYVFRRLMQPDNADAHRDSESTRRQRMLRINRDPIEHAAKHTAA